MADRIKRKRLFQFFCQKEADVILVQETHATNNNKRFWKNEWGGKSIFSNGDNNARGVAILFARYFNGNILKIFTDDIGRVVICEIEINDQTIALCNTYAPNDDNVDFFDFVMEKLMEYSADHVIWGGDLNVYLSERDKKGGKFTMSEAVSFVNNFMEVSAWVDAWRYFNGDRFEFTWKRSKPNPIFSRLDYYLIPEGTIDFVQDSKIIPGFLSDHSYVQIVLGFF